MRVLKRDGTYEDISFDKVLHRIRKLCNGLTNVSADGIAQQVCSRIYDGVRTSELDELAAQLCAGKITEHPDYGVLASRIVVSNHQKKTSPSFSETMSVLYNAKDLNGTINSLISEELYQIVMTHKDKLNQVIDYDRDFDITYFGHKTLERSYLTKVDGKIVERTQHLWMRVALGIHGWDLKEAIDTYNYMSLRKFTHATPTLFNAGTKTAGLSSCFVADTEIFTINRGIVKIQDVQINDTVVTHTGNVHKVTQLHRNLIGDRTLFDIKLFMTPNLKVTGNHKFMSIKQKDFANYIKNESFDITPQWHSIEDLQQGDYIMIPKKNSGISQDKIDLYDIIKNIKHPENRIDYQFSCDEEKLHMKCEYTINGNQHTNKQHKASRYTNSINRFLTIDEDFSWFLGVWYGDGCITYGKSYDSQHQSRYNTPRNIQIVSCKENTKLIEKVISIGNDKFGVNASISYMKTQNLVQIIWNSKIMSIVFEELFGRGFAGKKLDSRMFEWNDKLLYPLLGGLISSDGCCSKQGIISITMCNYNFLKGVYHLLRNNGICVSFHKVPKPNTWKYATPYAMSVPKIQEVMTYIVKYYADNRLENINNTESWRNRSLLQYEDNTYLKIHTKIECTNDIPAYVYTVGVENDHSYNVEGLVCENCFLMGMDDSIRGIYKNLGDCAQISKTAGGIGIHVHNIRAKNSYIRGTNGTSSGIIPMLRVFNETAKYVNQSGRRNGSIAVYLEPWHADIQSFIELRKNSGNEDERTRDLFTALWVPDLFMKRVQENGDWHLMCPDECPRLSDTYGDEFEALYQSYVDAGKFRKVIKAQELWMAILKSQIETGTPYMGYKDNVNRKTNQANLGVIKSSNLCIEINEYSDHNQYASCNLASISLPAFVKKRDNGEVYYDFDELHSITQVVIRNLNKVIDKCYYSMDEIKKPNMQTRPLGLGVQGLADVFFLMKLPFESKEAAEINRQIAETMYHAALTSSMLIAKKRNELLDEYEDSILSVQRKTEIAKYLMLIDEERELTTYRGAYSKFVGSPIHSGKLQFDQWGVTPSDKYDWTALKEEIAKYGVRNSLLIAYMPTASSSQILGNYESFEPVTSNVFVRDTLAGNFIIPNKYLINDLIERGLWSSEMKDRLVAENGSIQNIPGIPDDVKQLYKTVYEVKQKAVIDMSAARGAYVCQSQSLNIYLPDADINRLSNVHFYGWKSGLKTGSYYTRILQAVRMTNYAAEVKDVAKEKPTEEQIAACSRDNKEACLMCSG